MDDGTTCRRRPTGSMPMDRRDPLRAGAVAGGVAGAAVPGGTDGKEPAVDSVRHLLPALQPTLDRHRDTRVR